MGWIPEGQRTASMSYTAQSQVAPYVTLGEEDTVTFEAEAAAQGFEDVNATATMRLLQKTMRKEETACSAAIRRSRSARPPRRPSRLGHGATLPAATYSVIVVALTVEGYRNSSVDARRRHQQDHHRQGRQHLHAERRLLERSANATQAVTLGQTLSATAPIVNGAVAYAWYVGTAGPETLQAITTINSADLQRAAGDGPAGRERDHRRQFAQRDARLRRLLTVGFNPATAPMSRR